MARSKLQWATQSVETVSTDLGTAYIERFPCLGAMLDALTPWEQFQFERDDFTKETLAQSRQYMRHGNESYAAKARELLDKIETSGLDSCVTTWGHDVAGAYPDVGAFLANDPECMLRPVRQVSNRAPIRVIASGSMSWTVTPAQALQRGTAILALVMRLAAERPIELYVSTEQGDKGKAHITLTRIATAPLDLATAAYALCSTGWYRGIMFPYSKNGAPRLPNNMPFAWGSAPWRDGWNESMRQVLGLGEHDLYLPGVNGDDDVFANPVSWVNDQLAKYKGD